MKISNLHLSLAAAVLLAQTSGGCVASSETKTSQQPSPISMEEVLWWLPEDTESVAVDQNSPLSAQKPDTKTSLKTGVAEVGLGGAGRGKFAEQLVQVPISRIITGSRKFRETGGFGLTPYEGCSIINLQSDLPKDNALQNWLTKNAKRTEIVAGYKTFIFDEKLEQDQWHFLIVQVRPDLLLCATNKSFLESVLRRRNRSRYERQKTTRALPANLAEWKYVDTSSSEWALRHYRKDQARFDPNSPFSKRAFLPDKSAIGLTYSLDEKRSIATVRYLTAPRNTTHMTKSYRELWSGLLRDVGNVPEQSNKWWPHITTNSNGVIDMKFHFAKPNLADTTGMFSFGLLALIGHAIIV